MAVVLYRNSESKPAAWAGRIGPLKSRGRSFYK